MPETPFEQQLLAAEPAERARLLKGIPDGVGEAEVHALAERARAAGTADPVESLRVAEASLALAEALGAARGRALALRAQAVALRAQSRWQEAVDSFGAAVAAAREAGDPLLAAQIPIAATEALAQLGRYDEAFRLAADIEAQLRSLGADEDAAKVLANTGNIHFQREEYAAALGQWEGALAYFVTVGQEVPSARLRMNIANVLTHLNRLPEALAMYHSGRAALEAAGMTVLVASVDLNTAYLRYMEGEYTEALQAYARARERFTALGLVRETAVCDRETGDVYLALNLIPEAREAYERVLPVFTDLHMSAEAARSEMGLATTLAARGGRDAALEALERAEQAFAREKNAVGVARARLQRAEWQPEREEDARAALRTYRRQGMRLGELQVRLWQAEQRVRAGAAPVRQLRQIMREVEAGGFLQLGWRVLAALARASRNAGRERAALAYSRQAVEAVEHARQVLRGEDFRIAFLEDKVRVYEDLLALLLERGTRAALEEAFQVAERAKSRALLEQLSGALAEEGAGGAEREALLERLQALRAQLNWDYGRLQQLGDSPSRLPVADAELPDRLRELEREYLRIQRQLQLRQAGGAARTAAAPRAADLRPLLAEDEQLVEYGILRDEVFAFVIDRKQFRVVQGLAARSDVEREVARLRFQWSKFGIAGYAERHAERMAAAARETLGALYELLLAPLAPLLPGERVTVIPHGLLHGVPFHALFDGERHALDRWEFACAPSAAVWRAGRLRGEPEGRGSLVYGISDPSLAHIDSELAGLRRTLPGAIVYQDGAATLAAVPESGSYHVLHFATHAIFRQDNPLFSGMRMADGWLIAHDLYHRRLSCRLATLSACRTGVSHVTAGDELLGLPRAFLHAGARAVLVSLWAADDAATAALMQECYRHLAAGTGRAAALRAAQQATRERFPHPYHWAAFALIGAR